MGESRSAFSLVEVLVVIGVATTLVVLSFAGWSRAVESAKVTKCLGNLQSIGTAAALFSAENDGLLPQSSHQGPSKSWQYVLPQYLQGQEKKIFVSPLAPNPTSPISYAINDYLTAHPYGAPSLDYSRRQSLASPVETMFFTLQSKEYGATDHFHFADREEGGYTPVRFSGQVQTNVSCGSGHYLFVDGHVERLRWEVVQTELTRKGSKFIDPSGHK